MSARDGVSALSYRMLDCPDQVVIAQVDDKGFLSSGSLTGISSLLITSQETFGVNQTLILAVKVSSRAAAWKVVSHFWVEKQHPLANDSEIHVTDLLLAVIVAVFISLMNLLLSNTE